MDVQLDLSPLRVGKAHIKIQAVLGDLKSRWYHRLVEFADAGAQYSHVRAFDRIIEKLRLKSLELGIGIDHPFLSRQGVHSGVHERLETRNVLQTCAGSEELQLLLTVRSPECVEKLASKHTAEHLGRRIETRELYLRNAIADARSKPGGAEEVWDAGVCEQVSGLAKLLKAEMPAIVFTFGAFSFEFARRAIGPEPARRYGQWGTDELGEAFRSAVERFDTDRMNLFPVLHITIARGRLLQAHEYFRRVKGGNYFDIVSHQLAERDRIDSQEEMKLFCKGLEAKL